MLVEFMAKWYIYGQMVNFYGHLVHIVAIWYIFLVLVCCTKKKSGNPASVSGLGPILFSYVRSPVFAPLSVSSALGPRVPIV
jgi:hypothetical protein